MNRRHLSEADRKQAAKRVARRLGKVKAVIFAYLYWFLRRGKGI